jgi:hypothetical protein
VNNILEQIHSTAERTPYEQPRLEVQPQWHGLTAGISTPLGPNVFDFEEEVSE